jgi:hypothetical protein
VFELPVRWGQREGVVVDDEPQIRARSVPASRRMGTGHGRGHR